ncbi:MAG: hypothetical protein E7618_03200 [Ruminococcaceae bacterium]|nr:hypothetical protein [Oscillospiraceae bacterium]
MWTGRYRRKPRLCPKGSRLPPSLPKWCKAEPPRLRGFCRKPLSYLRGSEHYPAA